MYSQLGSFPMDWQQARKTGTFYKVTRENALHVISGKDTPTLLSFRASSDCVHMGEMTIPAGGIGPRQTEYDSHQGDAVFYVRHGVATFLMEGTEDVFEVHEKEYMFIPANISYKCINYESSVLMAVFIIAPKL